MDINWIWNRESLPQDRQAYDVINYFCQPGSFNKIRRVIKVLGMVNYNSSFEITRMFINDCSELIASVWGTENGVGVRSAVGFASLPDNIPVEIEELFELV